MKRCIWCNINNKLYVDYHDNEWGIPVYDDRKLFEFLVLESFQAGLSWLCILNKRESFRKSFDNFDPIKISKYSEEKISTLLTNKDIVRCKRKIEATINNAIVFLNIQKEWGTFSNYIWHFTNNKIIKNIDNNIKTTSQLSDEISNDLKKKGMKYTGSTIIYSYLQAIGVINDHEFDCYKY
jgi:DNA-3-methyladenine glycosylase I